MHYLFICLAAVSAVACYAGICRQGYLGQVMPIDKQINIGMNNKSNHHKQTLGWLRAFLSKRP